MTWNAQVRASIQQRQLSRILQLLEGQRLVVHSFTAELVGEEVRVAFCASSDEDKAHRVQALLYRLHGVLEVALAPEGKQRDRDNLKNRTQRSPD